MCVQIVRNKDYYYNVAVYMQKNIIDEITPHNTNPIDIYVQSLDK